MQIVKHVVTNKAVAEKKKRTPGYIYANLIYVLRHCFAYKIFIGLGVLDEGEAKCNKICKRMVDIVQLWWRSVLKEKATKTKKIASIQDLNVNEMVASVEVLSNDKEKAERSKMCIKEIKNRIKSLNEESKKAGISAAEKNAITEKIEANGAGITLLKKWKEESKE